VVLGYPGELHPTHAGTLELRCFSRILFRWITSHLISVDREIHCVCVSGLNSHCYSLLNIFCSYIPSYLHPSLLIALLPCTPLQCIKTQNKHNITITFPYKSNSHRNKAVRTSGCEPLQREKASEQSTTDGRVCRRLRHRSRSTANGSCLAILALQPGGCTRAACSQTVPQARPLQVQTFQSSQPCCDQGISRAR